jgi:hypothetical protein
VDVDPARPLSLLDSAARRDRPYGDGREGPTVPATATTIQDGDDDRRDVALVSRAVEPAPTPDGRAGAIDELITLAGGCREPLERARDALQRRLWRRSDDFEATQGLRIIEGALGRVARPDEPWASRPRRRGRRAGPPRRPSEQTHRPLEGRVPGHSG